MINYGCRGLSESAPTRARAIEKGRKRKGGKGEFVVGATTSRIVGRGACKLRLKVVENRRASARVHDEISEPSDIYGSSQ